MKRKRIIFVAAWLVVFLCACWFARPTKLSQMSEKQCIAFCQRAGVLYDGTKDYEGFGFIIRQTIYLVEKYPDDPRHLANNDSRILNFMYDIRKAVFEYYGWEDTYTGKTHWD